MKKNIIIAFILSTLCISCHQTEQSAQGADTIDVRLALLPIGESTPFIYAHEAGLFDSLKIKVSVRPYDSAMDLDTAVLRGHVNMFITDTVRLAHLKDSLPGLKTLRIVPAEYMLLTADTTVLKIAHLKDRTIAITRHSAINKLFDSMKEKNALSDTDCFGIQVNDVNLRLKMVEQGHVTAAFLPRPQSDSALAHGLHRIPCADTLASLAFVYLPTTNLTAEKAACVMKIYETAASAIHGSQPATAD